MVASVKPLLSPPQREGGCGPLVPPVCEIGPGRWALLPFFFLVLYLPSPSPSPPSSGHHADHLLHAALRLLPPPLGEVRGMIPARMVLLGEGDMRGRRG
jgi:hypothetical protein